jgi:TetR/AcrR family transcriptional repressor of nem operon
MGLATFFWIGWEGAVLRAKLELSARPLDIFSEAFFAGLKR